MSQAMPKEMIKVTMPDDSVREYATGTTGMDIANDISKSLAKASIAIKVNGEIRDLGRPIEEDVSIEIMKREHEDALEMIRHDAAHVMAEAVQSLFPGTQVTIGPAIEDGFYYDFARNESFSTEDFEAIEKEMRKIVERGDAFEREVWDRNDAIKFFKDKGEMYKAELIEDLPEDETITIYKQGEWLDLCRGPAHADDKTSRHRLQTPESCRSVLARRFKQRHAHPYLRHGVARPKGTGRLSAPVGGSRKARPPQAG